VRFFRPDGSCLTNVIEVIILSSPIPGETVLIYRRRREALIRYLGVVLVAVRAAF
jgi:hypothetical protein